MSDDSLIVFDEEELIATILGAIINKLLFMNT